MSTGSSRCSETPRGSETQHKPSYIMVDTTDEADIPVIDLNATDAAARLLEAATTYGFIFVEQHSSELSQMEVDETFRLAKQFFAAPSNVKAEYPITNNRGYVGLQGETLDPKKHERGDLKEGFNFGEFADGKAQQPLPELLKLHEAHFNTFLDRCHSLCDRILRLFAEALEISHDWFSLRHDRSKGPSGSICRLLHYPRMDGGEYVDNDIRAGAHSDYGSVTCLFREVGQPGLEVLTPDDEWAAVPVKPKCLAHSAQLPILVNIGDLLSFWTNGLLKSTVHRVVFPNPKDSPDGAQDRYSVVYFCHPLDSASLAPIPSRIIAERRATQFDRPPNESAMTAQEYLHSRLAATYGL